MMGKNFPKVLVIFFIALFLALMIFFLSGCKYTFKQIDKFLNRPNILCLSKNFSKIFIYDSRKFRILVSDLDFNYITELQLPISALVWGMDTTEDNELYIAYKYFKEYSDSEKQLEENSITVLACYQISNGNLILKNKISWEGLNRPIHTPSDIKLLDKKHLIIGDFQTNYIYKVTLDGKIVSKFGGFGHDNGNLYYPTNIIIKNVSNEIKEIYIIEAYNHRISVFDKDGNFLRCYTGDNKANIKLSFPMFGCFDDNGNIYVTELSKQQISVFSHNFTFIKAFSPLAQNFNEQIYELFSICFIPANRELFVVDSINGCIHIFNQDGVLKKIVTELK